MIDKSRLSNRARYKTAPKNATQSRNLRVLKYYKYYVLFALFSFATALKPFLGDDNRNLLLIGFMGLSPALVFVRHIPRNHQILYLFMISIILFQSAVNPEYLRWSTIFYTLMFCFSFIAYENVLRRSKMNIGDLTKAVRFLLLAYVVVFVAQQFSVLTGLPIVNESNYNSARDPWKLNSLSAEASHAARMISLLMFAYLSIQEIRTGQNYSLKRQFKKDRYIWLGYMWCILTMQSTTSILLAPIILIKIINRKNSVYVFIFICLAAFAITMTSSEVFERTLNFIEAASTLDYRLLLAADHSGALRIAPLLVLTERVEFFSWHGMFGNGIDSVSEFMSDYIYGIKEGATGGGMLLVWYEYGSITLLLFVVFSIRVASALRSVSNFTLWLFIVFLASPNNQTLWFFLILSTSINYFRTTEATTHLKVRRSMRLKGASST